MDTNTILWGVGCVVAGYVYWLVDWKTKTEINITKLQEYLEAHFKESETYRSNVTHDIHKLELELADRMRRDELKNDFSEFKKEIRDLIRGILASKDQDV